MFIELERKNDFSPPTKGLLITWANIPTMCAEFDPNPDQTYAEINLVDLNKGIVQKIDNQEAKKIYNSKSGKALCRRDRINLWQAMKTIL